MTTYAALRALAEKATPGPWVESGRDVDHDRTVAEGRNPGDGCGLGCEVEGPPEAWLRGQFALHADAAYIAAVDPATILALLDDLDAAQARIAELEASLGTDEHIVTFSEDGYGLQHPIRCRPDLLGCSVNVYLAYRDEPDMPPGKWTVQLLGDGDPLYTAIAAAREGGSK